MKAPTILIVDDEPSNLAIMRDALQSLYNLVFARNGAETQAAVIKHRPAMVLLDIGLPDTDGAAMPMAGNSAASLAWAATSARRRWCAPRRTAAAVSARWLLPACG